MHEQSNNFSYYFFQKKVSKKSDDIKPCGYSFRTSLHYFPNSPGTITHRSRYRPSLPALLKKQLNIINVTNSIIYYAYSGFLVLLYFLMLSFRSQFFSGREIFPLLFKTLLQASLLLLLNLSLPLPAKEYPYLNAVP